MGEILINFDLFCCPGDCGSGIECGGNGPSVPVSIAQIEFDVPITENDLTNWFDVSLMDGYNIPVAMGK